MLVVNSLASLCPSCDRKYLWSFWGVYFSAPLLQAAGALFSHIIFVPTRVVNSIRIVVVYCQVRGAHEGAALRVYLEEVCQAAKVMGEAALQREVFVRGLQDRVRKNLRLFRIAVLFLFPMVVRYHRTTGRSIFDNINPEDLLQRSVSKRSSFALSMCKLETEFQGAKVCGRCLPRFGTEIVANPWPTVRVALCLKAHTVRLPT